MSRHTAHVRALASAESGSSLAAALLKSLARILSMMLKLCWLDRRCTSWGVSPRRASADLAEAEDTASGCFLGELWCSLEGTADREIPGDDDDGGGGGGGGGGDDGDDNDDSDKIRLYAGRSVLTS